MKYSLDTNVIISHFKGDKFSDDTDNFFTWIKNSGHDLYIALITWNPSDYDINKAVMTPMEVIGKHGGTGE